MAEPTGSAPGGQSNHDEQAGAGGGQGGRFCCRRRGCGLGARLGSRLSLRRRCALGRAVALGLFFGLGLGFFVLDLAALVVFLAHGAGNLREIAPGRNQYLPSREQS